MFGGQRCVPYGYQQLGSGVMTAAQSIAAVGAANAILISAESQNIRIRDDGTAPTSSSGFLITTTSGPFEYTGPITSIQIIGAAAGAVANLLFYRLSG